MKRRMQEFRHPILLVMGFVLFLTFFVPLFWVEHAQAPSQNGLLERSVTYHAQLKDHDFIVEIADTPEAQQKGLSGTKSLLPEDGMLFIFDQPTLTCFWMKDMHYNLDIIWFDANKKLIYMQQDLSPSTYPSSYCPNYPAKYVVELVSGTAAHLQLKTGDELGLNQNFSIYH